MNEQKLLNKNFVDEDKIEARSVGGGSKKGKSHGVNMNGSQNANGLLNSSKISITSNDIARNKGITPSGNDKGFDKNALIR